MNKEKYKKILFEIIFLMLICSMGAVYFHNPQQETRYNYGLEFIKQITEIIFM